MLDSIRDLNNEIAYLRNNCHQVLDLLKDLEKAGKDQTDLTSYQHDLIRSHNRRYADGMRVHLDIAAGYVSDWVRNVLNCLEDRLGRGM